LTCSCEIAAIEFVDRVSVGEGLVALRCVESDSQDAAFYSEFLPPGTVVEVISDPGK
jgi:hypothetical protein